MSNRYGVPDKTLQDKVRFMYAHDDAKHGLASKGQSTTEYADEKINRLSNAELVELLSTGLEEILRDRCDPL